MMDDEMIALQQWADGQGEVAYTINRKGRLIILDEMMIVQRPHNGRWAGVWASECLDEDDIKEGIEFMEGYCWCEPKLAFGPRN